jgi:hypothetical protein
MTPGVVLSRMKKLLWVISLCAVSAFGADVTGKWSGTIDLNRGGETKTDAALLDLKQDGNSVTGTVGPEQGNRFAIKTGRVEGNKIHLEVDPSDSAPSPGLIVFDLIVDGDRITGEMNGEADGGRIQGKLDVKRQKAD